MRRKVAAALMVQAAAALLAYLDLILKPLLASPRPNAASGLRIEELHTSYGFPSGHVYRDVVVLGTAALVASVWLPRRALLPARLAVACVIVMAGPARVYIGAHWPSDVLGGYLIGGAVLAFLYQAHASLSRRLGLANRHGLEFAWVSESGSCRARRRRSPPGARN